MALHAGRRYDAGFDVGEEANAAKYLAAEAAFLCRRPRDADSGRDGLRHRVPCGALLATEARLQRIIPVSQEMTLNYLAQHVLGLPRSY